MYLFYFRKLACLYQCSTAFSRTIVESLTWGIGEGDENRVFPMFWVFFKVCLLVTKFVCLVLKVGDDSALFPRIMMSNISFVVGLNLLRKVRVS